MRKLIRAPGMDWRHLIAVVLAALGLTCTSLTAAAQTADPPPEPPQSLKTVPIPEPENLHEFVQDRVAAIQLGKALFWDMQVGGDGVQACASCHFHAGADNRRKNQLNPALLAGDSTFQLGGPNYTVEPRDFPFTRHEDERTPGSPITKDTNDVMSSEGVFNVDFIDVQPGAPADDCRYVRDTVFHVNGINTRRVEPRNTPTTINAVFNHRNFWDGRAQDKFNGVNPFGERDENARVWRHDPATGEVRQVSVELHNASLASQAAGPPLSDFEMGCANRIFAKIGVRLLDSSLVPLQKQEVHPNDSVLGPIARPHTGLAVSYEDLVRKAFRPEWWAAPGTVTMDGETYRQMEANFALIFGLAVQLYETELIADDTPFDRYLEGQSEALDELEQQGFAVFMSQGKCINCHGGAELTNASVRSVHNETLERMIMGDGNCAIYDNGFYNIGVRPTQEDVAVGGTDPFGNPLSDTRMAMAGKFHDPSLEPPLGDNPDCDNRAAVDGAFKTPSLRNVELTGPYFHNGGKGTLRQVVEFYNRGGDFADVNHDDLDPDIQPLSLSESQISALVAFMQALTDERVRQESAPFDHPQLFRPQGHPGDEKNVAVDGSGLKAMDDLFEVPAIGAGGRADEGLIPLQPFLTVTKMTGSGRLGTGRDLVQIGYKFRDHEDGPRGKLRVRERQSKLEIRADGIDRFFATETCVQTWGSAEVNKTPGYAFTAVGCDNGQFGHRDDDDRDDNQPGRRDWFEVTVWSTDGSVVYQRAGRLTGGNLHSHIK